MIALTAYFIKMLIWSGVLYGYYVLALKNNTFHRWNRGYLLLATLASILLPFLQFSFVNAPVPAYTVPLITVYGYLTNTVQQAGAFDIASWVTNGIYVLVMLLLITNMLRSWLLIKRLVKQGEQITFDNYQLIRHPQVKSTFSFFDHIFWGEELTPDSREGKQVLRHELEHVQGRHTEDKLFLQLVCAIFWFNPFFHLFKRELAMVHEFLADRAATAENAPDDYARTLLQMTLQTKHMLTANNFAHAPIKRRILMLFTQKTNHVFMKKAIIFPVVLLLGFIIGCRQDLGIQTPGNIDLTSSFTAKTPLGEIFTSVSEPPAFPGGEDAMAEYLSQHIRYPKMAQESNVGGTVFVRFVIDPDGNISNVRTIGSLIGNGLEEESMRVVKAMPKWTPGKHEGRRVSVEFNLPIRFILQE